MYQFYICVCVCNLKYIFLNVCNTMMRNLYSKNQRLKFLAFQDLLLGYHSYTEAIPRGPSHTASVWLFILLLLPPIHSLVPVCPLRTFEELESKCMPQAEGGQD